MFTIRTELHAIATSIAALPQTLSTPPRAYLVGGAVRDELMSLTSTDLDLEVYGVSLEKLESFLLERYGESIHLVGRQFGIFHLPCSDGTIDIALPRTESKMDSGHKGFHVTGNPDLSFTEACRRRDFTINAILKDPLTGELIDPFNGRKDLEQKTLRIVDEHTFHEDPLRFYRAIQFCARFEFSCDNETLRILATMVADGELHTLSPSRITEEWKKLLTASKPSIGFELMKSLGVLERDYQELFALEATPQEPEWHPEGNVWIHTMMVVDQAARIAQREQLHKLDTITCVLGALCHDLGKPITTAPLEKDGVTRIRSLGHEKAGIEPTRQLLSRFTFGAAMNDYCEKVAHYHLQPTVLYREWEKGTTTEEQYRNGLRTFLKKLEGHDWKLFLLSCEADYRGRSIPGVQDEPFKIGSAFSDMVKRYQLDVQARTPLISGAELLARGVHEGKQIGDLMRMVENARDHGHIATREEAWELVEEEMK